MIKHFVRHTFTLILLAAVVAGFNSCKDEISLIADDGSIPDMTGEQVTFNTALSSAVESLSRSYIYDKNYENDSYHAGRILIASDVSCSSPVTRLWARTRKV